MSWFILMSAKYLKAFFDLYEGAGGEQVNRTTGTGLNGYSESSGHVVISCIVLFFHVCSVVQ